MANTYISLESIAKRMLPRLVENLVMPNLCYKDLSNEFVAGLGTKVQMRKPFVFEGKDYKDGSAITVQDIAETSVEVNLDKMADVSIAVTSLEQTMKMGDAKMNEVIDGMAVALAEKINKEGLKQVAKASNIMGTAGTTPDGLDDFANIRQKFNEELAPKNGRVALWNPEADAKFVQLGNLVKVNEAGAPSALREGEIGKVYGIDNYGVESLPVSGSHSISTSSPSYALNSDGSISVTKASGITHSFEIGDVVTVTGEPGTPKHIIADIVAITNGYKFVFGTPVADGITPTGFTSVNAKLNMAFQRDAIAFVTRPLSAPQGADSCTINYNGLGLRLVRDYDITYKKETISVDFLYNYEVVRPEHVIAYLG